MPPAQLGETLRSLRLCGDDELRRMQQSLVRHGQLTALCVYRTETGALEVVDGFKRLGAARALGWPSLRVSVVATRPVQAKAALRVLNQSPGYSELEEAWLCRSLYREDGLTQPEIGRLLGRHKSWVCKRLALSESLDEAVQADVRLGLLGASSARVLGRLPRGNQREAADVVIRRGLTLRQTERLVRDALACPYETRRRRLLADAMTGTPAPSSPTRTAVARTPAEWIVADASAAARLCARLQARLLAGPLAALGAPAAALVVEGLLRLSPVLASLHHQIAHACAKESSHAEMDHPRRARPADGDAAKAGRQTPGDRPGAGSEP